MITRCWGEVNDTHVDFTPIPDRPDYWEGIAPRVPGLQDIEIWAENDRGARGHIHVFVSVYYWTPTSVRLVLSPYDVEFLGVMSGSRRC